MASLNTDSCLTFIEGWLLLHQAGFEVKPTKAVQWKTKEGAFKTDHITQKVAIFSQFH
jgi:hypothetical protein